LEWLESQSDSQNKNENDLGMIAIAGVWFGVVIISFVLIIYRVLSTEIYLARMNKTVIRRSALVERQEIKDVHKNTKVVTIQALAYLVSFCLSIGLLLIRALINEPDWLIYLSITLMPLQGFFNLLIFLGHKVYNFRRVNADISRWDTIKILFRGAHEEPVIFSRISLVRLDQEKRELDYEYSDEGGNEQVHHIQYADQADSPSHSPSQSVGAEAFADDGSTRGGEADLEDLSAFQSVGVMSTNSKYSSKQDDSRGRLSGVSFMSRSQPCGNGDSESRGGLSGFSFMSRSQPHSNNDSDSFRPEDN
jgi:hypothetical protein